MKEGAYKTWQTNLEHVNATLVLLECVIDQREQVLQSLEARDAIHEVEEGLGHLRGTLLHDGLSGFGIGGAIEAHNEFEIFFRDNLRPVSSTGYNVTVRKARSRNLISLFRFHLCIKISR